MYVAIDMGGAYLSSSNHPDKFKAMKKILYDFAKEMSEEVVKKQIKDATKVLEGFLSAQKNLEKENEGLHKDIENYKEKIKKAEDDIKTNLADQNAKKKEIEAQQKAVDALQEKLKGIK
jgi:predicted RNase H-like nuclease (RuvC/YqgF family)